MTQGSSSKTTKEIEVNYYPEENEKIEQYKKRMGCRLSGVIPVEDGLLDMHWIIFRPEYGRLMGMSVVFTKRGKRRLIFGLNATYGLEDDPSYNLNRCALNLKSSIHKEDSYVQAVNEIKQKTKGE
jgi:hypothetical protein